MASENIICVFQMFWLPDIRFGKSLPHSISSFNHEVGTMQALGLGWGAEDHLEGPCQLEHAITDAIRVTQAWEPEQCTTFGPFQLELISIRWHIFNLEKQKLFKYLCTYLWCVKWKMIHLGTSIRNEKSV